MFDIGFQEILMVSVLALLIMGPERLPGAIRTGSLWLAKLRRSFSEMKAEIENEVGINADDIRMQLHNEGVLKSIEKSKQQLKDGVDALNIKGDLQELAKAIDPASDATPPEFSRAAQQAKAAKEALQAAVDNPPEPANPTRAPDQDEDDAGTHKASQPSPADNKPETP
ncbi:Sec-independent protein translocase protein TatB [Dasania marina]|uniref:Sec-independent protein translocase protein TatB n=1 Tax=Dasania marina TaxID=471499 RepID=UPI000381DA72|nr:Sec-independent protein translocase protein TatB [Dasania marina]